MEYLITFAVILAAIETSKFLENKRAWVVAKVMTTHRRIRIYISDLRQNKSRI